MLRMQQGDRGVPGSRFVPSADTKDTTMGYEAPTITRLGSIADFTHGGDPESLGDGVAFRGPATDPVPSS
jgi:hypothetical protein